LIENFCILKSTERRKQSVSEFGSWTMVHPFLIFVFLLFTGIANRNNFRAGKWN